MIKPFTIHIDQAILDDLRSRLSATRWPAEIENKNWEAGTDKAYLQELCSYWQNDFNWREQESRLNSFPQYEADIDGAIIHFIHLESGSDDAVPLLLIHGYPDSFSRFEKLIPLLNDEKENNLRFDIIVPSIPGYGFSPMPEGGGMTPQKIAKIFHELMTNELGYKKYIAHGGDWGSTITEQLALYHADDLLGIHLTDVPFGHGMEPVKDPGTAEEKYEERTKKWKETEGGYAAIQSTKPLTLAYSLNDSPAGLAAWFVEILYLDR